MTGPLFLLAKITTRFMRKYQNGALSIFYFVKENKNDD